MTDHASWTKEDIRTALQSTNISQAMRDLGRTYYAIQTVKSSYNRWKKGIEIPAKSLIPFFEQIGDIPLSAKVVRTKTSETPAEMAARMAAVRKMKKFDLDEIRTIVQSFPTKSDQEIADKTGRTIKRIKLLRSFYANWQEKGVVYGHNKKIARLFSEVHKELGLPISPDYNPKGKSKKDQSLEPPQELYTPMPSEKRDPFTEMDILMEDFKERLITLIPEIVKELVSQKYSEGYQKGKEEALKKQNKVFGEKVLAKD